MKQMENSQVVEVGKSLKKSNTKLKIGNKILKRKN